MVNTNLRHRQYLYIADYLTPVVDAIAEQMEACVSLNIMMPVSTGEVEVRTLHANWPGGVPGITWPVVDLNGYKEATRSMKRYACSVFRKDSHSGLDLALTRYDIFSFRGTQAQSV